MVTTGKKTPATVKNKSTVAIVANAAESKNAGDENGEAKYDVTVVAVLVDDNGVIQECIIDGIVGHTGFVDHVFNDGRVD